MIEIGEEELGVRGFLNLLFFSVSAGSAIPEPSCLYVGLSGIFFGRIVGLACGLLDIGCIDERSIVDGRVIFSGEA
ncbi:hypothetical protein [Bartonella sp. B39]